MQVMAQSTYEDVPTAFVIDSGRGFVG